MGMYTGIRFKGYVKKEFREDFEHIALAGEWDKSHDPIFNLFGKLSRSSFIPCGCLSYMPDCWEKDYINEKGEKEPEFDSDKNKPLEQVKYFKKIPTDGFDRTWNKNTGYWTFQCSLKNYELEIETWICLLPYFIESIEHLEYYYEENSYSQQYDFVDGKVICIDKMFIKYQEEY